MHFSASTFFAPYLHQFSAVLGQIMQFLDAFWDKFVLDLMIICIKFFFKYAGTAPSSGAIWDECIS